MAEYVVTYKRGLGRPVKVDAETPEEAAKNALALYRYHTYGPDMKPVSEVVESVEPVQGA